MISHLGKKAVEKDSKSGFPHLIKRLFRKEDILNQAQAVNRLKE